MSDDYAGYAFCSVLYVFLLMGAFYLMIMSDSKIAKSSSNDTWINETILDGKASFTSNNLTNSTW